MLHVLVGDNQGDINLVTSFAKTKQPLFWTVPKKARPGEPVLFFIRAQGFIARGVIGASPKMDSQKRYTASVLNIVELRHTMPLEFVLKFHKGWKWPNFPLRNTTISGAIQTRLEELLKGYEEVLDDEPEEPAFSNRRMILKAVSVSNAR